jgi:tetratricopeptide (TPR) repeat protein
MSGHDFTALERRIRAMLKYAIATVLSLSATGAFCASFVDDRAMSEAQRYDRCLKLAHDDAARAYDQALAWHDSGGGPPAEHCSAVALFQQKHYAEAAFKLDSLARERGAGDADLRANLLDEAGNAWILAGRPESAEASLSAALKLGDRSADTFADRARARALGKDWAGAEADLNLALAVDENRADLLVLRASARHAMGKRNEARGDVDKALELYPQYADALVERGAMKLEAGDANGARSDWKIVLATQPKSAAADSARTHIEQLELGARAPRNVKRTKQTPTPKRHQDRFPT